MSMSEIKKILERLRTFTVPELCDGLPLYHVMDHEIKPRVGSTHIVGTAVTVDVPHPGRVASSPMRFSR